MSLFVLIIVMLLLNAVNAENTTFNAGTNSTKESCRSAKNCPKDWACVKSLCVPFCNNDRQCIDGHVCRSNSTVKLCSKRKLFPDFTFLDGLTSFVTFIGAMLAAGGGLGGGGIFVPSFIIISGLTARQAVALSQAMIFGGSIVNMFFNMRKRHPEDLQRPLIDYDAVLVLEPLMLAGTIIGVLANQTFPAWLIVVSLAVILVYVTFRTARRCLRLWKAEHAEDKTSEPEVVGTSSIPMSEIHNPIENSDISEKGCYEITKSVEEIPTSSSSVLVNIIARERNQWLSLLFVGTIFALLLLMSLLRGGKAGTTSVIGVENCSPAYWGLTAATFMVLTILTFICGFYVRRKYNIKKKCGYKFLEGDIDWTTKNVIMYPLLSIGAGLTGGLLGIGGGMIMGPLLLELGMLPSTTAATSATTVLVTSASGTMLFLIMGGLLLDYGVWYFSLGIIATLLGQSLIDYLVRKYHSTSLIVMTIVIVMIISTLLLIVTGIINIVDDVKSGHSMGFISPCDN